MSAVPKKKLCWNCEGNVSREIDNCPYCGVYLQIIGDEEDTTSWNPSYHLSDSKQEEIPTPHYQLQPTIESEETEPKSQQGVSYANSWSLLFSQEILLKMKEDVLPLLLLMAGSLFFLFGVILFLFADQEGSLTLQWKGSHWIYFLGLSIPLACLGWTFLKQIEPDQ